MLAYYVEWNMRRDLAPLLFHDQDRALAELHRPSIVAPAPRSKSAKAKDRTKHTAEGLPVQSFRDLLGDLATVVKDRIKPKASTVPEFDKMTISTPLQQRAFELLRVHPLKL